MSAGRWARLHLRAPRLRTRITCWYLLSTAGIALILCTALYAFVARSMMQTLQENLTLAVSQIAAQTKVKGGVEYEEETPIDARISFAVLEKSGSEAACGGEPITELYSCAYQPETFVRVHLRGETWIMLDSPMIHAGHYFFFVRAAISCTETRSLLRALLLAFGLGLPLLAALAALAGYAVSGRVLSPIAQIIRTANEIARSGSASRIPSAQTQDELGELIDTLNRMLDSLDAAMQRERRFLSDASHELRTPVAIIQGYTESLLAQPDLSTQQRDTAQIILRECSRMRRIVSQMLMLMRGLEGRYPIEPEPLALYDVCACISRTLEEQLCARRMTMTIDVPEDFTLVADQSLLTQLMLNLIENAVKYGREGGRIRIAAAAEGSVSRITVADDGVGIRPEDLPHIFDRFFRADAARDRSGTGLGLSIVKWIADAHGASVCASSTPDAGTVFTLLWPRADG